MGVTAQEAAISAMVNWRASYMRWAFPISSGVILGFRPPLRAAGAGGGEPGRVRSRMRAASYSAIRPNIPHTRAPCAEVVPPGALPRDRTGAPRACRAVRAAAVRGPPTTAVEEAEPVQLRPRRHPAETQSPGDLRVSQQATPHGPR